MAGIFLLHPIPSFTPVMQQQRGEEGNPQILTLVPEEGEERELFFNKNKKSRAGFFTLSKCFPRSCSSGAALAQGHRAPLNSLGCRGWIQPRARVGSGSLVGPVALLWALSWPVREGSGRRGMRRVEQNSEKVPVPASSAPSSQWDPELLQPGFPHPPEAFPARSSCSECGSHTDFAFSRDGFALLGVHAEPFLLGHYLNIPLDGDWDWDWMPWL